MSEKPIAERLQVKNNRRIAVLGASPELDHAIGAVEARIGLARADVVLVAARDRAQLESALPRTLAEACKTAILWVAYPKLSSPLASDLSRDIIYGLAPSYGLNTVSSIAIDVDWSALRLKRV